MPDVIALKEEPVRGQDVSRGEQQDISHHCLRGADLLGLPIAHHRHLGVTGQSAQLPELLLLLVVVHCCDQGHHGHSRQDGRALYPTVLPLSECQLQADAGHAADEQYHNGEILQRVAYELPEGHLCRTPLFNWSASIPGLR